MSGMCNDETRRAAAGQRKHNGSNNQYSHVLYRSTVWLLRYGNNTADQRSLRLFRGSRTWQSQPNEVVAALVVFFFFVFFFFFFFFFYFFFCFFFFFSVFSFLQLHSLVVLGVTHDVCSRAFVRARRRHFFSFAFPSAL